VHADDEENRAPPEERADLPVTPPPEGPPRTFRGDRRHTGRSAYVGPRAAGLAWAFETEGRITAQPVVGPEGRIYVGSHDGYLYALSPYGQQEWRVSLGGPIYSTPLVDADGHLYVGSDAGVFTSLDASGEIRWRLDTEGDADTGAVLSPEGLVHFAAGQDLWAVKPDGTVEWRFRANGKIFTTPAVDEDGTVYVGSQDDHLYAVAADGRLRWSYRTEGDNDSSPVIGDDGTIYFGSDDHKVYALTRDGALRWSTDLEGMVRAPIGLSLDGAVLAGVFGPRPRVVSLDASSGDVRWYFPVTVADTTEIGVASGPLVDREGSIYFGAHDDYLYSLAPTGELRWVFEAAADVDSSPVLTPEGVLVFGSDDKQVYALRGDP
ncbi:MAG TPA: PQQ-binding-like beta-propeller repeat protein, partial [Polyangiaceae bacterium LLY-WYZ-15_(1-7)]|nr:PQQ-binding-like beta-propeller repeat protein [Polyangiaceae bacterium LLY-WYZ-15_(1-7)]